MLRLWFARRVKRWVLISACCLAVFAGVIVARWAALDNAWWLWLIGPVALLSLRRHNMYTLLILALLCFGMGWWRASGYVRKLALYGDLYKRSVTVIGVATDDAVYGRQSQLEFSMDTLKVVEPIQTKLVGSLAVRGFGEAVVYRGDSVQVTGKLYPSRGNNFGSVGYADLKVLERSGFWLYELRRRFAAGMQSALPEPAASFGLGLLIGQRSTLPQANADQLKRAGLTHVIAVSGYNLTIIVLACRRLLARRSKFQATFASCALIGLFLLITGSSPPIVRAAIISTLSIGAWYYGRTIKPLALLLFAAALTVMANPTYLWGNVSWWLSFLSFFGVLVLAPLLGKRLFGARQPGIVAGILLETACASLLVLPFILLIFGEMSLVALLANLLVVPLIPIAMVLCFVAGLGGMLVPAIAGWIAWPASWLLTSMLDIAQVVGRVPGAFIGHIAFSAWSMTAAYVLIGFVCITLWYKTRQNDTITEKIQD